MPGSPPKISTSSPESSDKQIIFNFLEKYCGEPIEQVVQEIRSLAMPLRISRQLGLRPDALALQLLRRYVTKDGVIIASFNWHPADQFVYKMKIDSNNSVKEN